MQNKILKFKNYKRGCDVQMCKTLEKMRGKSALELLNEYNISTTPPIDIEQLGEKIGIQIGAVDFSGLEDIMDVQKDSILGATYAKGNDLNLFYKVGSTRNRKRFTLAHELAHCSLHTDDLKEHHIEFRNNEKAESGKEYEASVFAGELLIPEESLLETYNQLIYPALSTLANIFDVSFTVMEARLDYLNMTYFKDVMFEEV